MVPGRAGRRRPPTAKFCTRLHVECRVQQLTGSWPPGGALAVVGARPGGGGRAQGGRQLQGAKVGPAAALAAGGAQAQVLERARLRHAKPYGPARRLRHSCGASRHGGPSLAGRQVLSCHLGNLHTKHTWFITDIG